jgi:hypothetical protein
MDIEHSQDETLRGSDAPERRVELPSAPTVHSVKFDDNTPPVWLQRASLVLLVVTCIYIGLLLMVLPWSRYWQENHFLAMLPERWAAWLQSGAARGVVSGFGLLDIWIGLSEAIHWRSRRAKARG